MSTALKKAVQPARVPFFGQNGTNVLGYFNGNPWPVQLAVSSLGRQFVIEPGKFVTDDRGNKFNDPAFEQYVGPDLLSREWVPSNAVPTPILRVPPAPKQSATNAAGFSGQPGVNKLSDNPPPAPAAPAAPSASVPPVRGYSREEARKLGLINDTHEPNKMAARDDGSLPPGEVLETIEYAHDVPTKRQRTPAPAPVEPPVIVHDEEEEKLASAIQKEAAVFNPDNPDVLTAVTKQVVRQVAQPIPQVSVPPTVPPQDFPLNLPEPNLTESKPEGAVPATTTDAEKGYICAADGRGFNYRSELARYVKRKYPDREAELLAKYPKN